VKLCHCNERIIDAVNIHHALYTTLVLKTIVMQYTQETFWVILLQWETFCAWIVKIFKKLLKIVVSCMIFQKC